MKRVFKISFLVLVLISLTAVSAHRFYTAIYQIQFVSQKKRVEITTRIFVDDLNEALKKQYHKSTFLGTEKETPEDIELMKKYLRERLKLTINGQPKAMNYLSKELDNNVVVCYFSIKDVAKISALGIENTILTELYSEQQNIMQFNNNGVKGSLLLTKETTKGMLN